MGKKKNNTEVNDNEEVINETNETTEQVIEEPVVEEVIQEPEIVKPDEEVKPEPVAIKEDPKPAKIVLGNYEVISTAKYDDNRAIDKFTRIGLDYVNEQGYIAVTNIKTEEEAKDIQLQILAIGYKSTIKVID